MNRELVCKYLSGRCDENERKTIKNWLDDSPENRRIMSEFKQVWDVSPGKQIQVNSYKAWNSFSENYLEDEHYPSNSSESGEKFLGSSNGINRKSNGLLNSRIIFTTSASVAVILIAFLFYSYNAIPLQNSQPELISQEITTEKGQRTTLRLSDGSRIHLNAESKLTVPKDYMMNERKVFLQGEAYFEVVSTKQKPFLVHTDESTTRVLGTKFNVRAYPDDKKVEVVVSEGKVALGSGDASKAPEVQLTKNQKGIISKDGEIQASNVSSLDVHMDWSNGTLSFRNAELAEVKSKLERWYDVQVVFDEQISSENRLLTGSFKDVSMKSVLNSIALSLELTYTQNGRIINFRPK